jgi:hypothetical protein
MTTSARIITSGPGVNSGTYGHSQQALADRLALARQAGIAARAARGASPLRTDFLDADNWTELAHTYGLRLPVWGTPCTTGAMTRWLKRTGLSVAWYREWSGYQSLQQWIDANPLWPLRAFAGLCLEEREAADYRAAQR